MRESHALPRFSIVDAELLRSGCERTIAKTTAPRFQQGWIRWKAEFGIFANTPDTDGAGRNLSTASEAVLVNLSGNKAGCAASPLVKERNGSQTEYTLFPGHRRRDLQEALGADDVGLEARSEWIAPPANARRVEAGAAQERIVENGAKRSA
jgi:hypothetical protein